MYGNNFTRSILGISYMFNQPKNFIRWVRNRIDKKTAIEMGVPWISWPAIDFINTINLKGLKVFEWGSGGSTIFFCNKGCNVKSVESNKGWLQKVTDNLKLDNYNVNIELIPAESKNEKDIKNYTEAVKNDGPWDIIMVDGLEEDFITRTDCIKIAKEFLTNKGIIILDDSYRFEYSVVPHILYDYEKLEFWGLGPDRLGVTKTDIYIKK